MRKLEEEECSIEYVKDIWTRCNQTVGSITIEEWISSLAWLILVTPEQPWKRRVVFNALLGEL